MLRIAIVEDEAAEREKLAAFCRRYFDEREENIEVRLFDDGDNFIEDYAPAPDLVFMDIEMKRLDGVSTAHRLREFDERVTLVFVTNLMNMALEGYSVNAADFVIKPVSYESFHMRMERIMRRMDSRKECFLNVKAGRESLIINARDILFIEAANKKTLIHLNNRKCETVTEPLYQLETALENEPFCRCHNAFLVNLKAVKGVSAAELTVGEDIIPLSKHRKKAFMTALANYRGSIL